MSYELKITATTADDLAQQVSALGSLLGGVAADPVMPEVKEATTRRKAADPKPEPAKTTEVKLDEKAVAEVTAQVEEAKVEEPAAETNDAPLDFQNDVLPKVFALTEKHGRDAVVKVLGEFGVPKASQVPVEKFAEFVAAIEKAIG